MLELHLDKTHHELESEHLDYLAKHTGFFSARDLEAMIKQGMHHCAAEFSEARSWRKVVPHPVRSEIEYALVPVVDEAVATGWPASCALTGLQQIGTAGSEAGERGEGQPAARVDAIVEHDGEHEGPWSKGGVIYNISAEQMIEQKPSLLKHTVLPTLSVRHLRRALEGAHITVTSKDLEEFAKWGGPRSASRV